MAYRTLIGRLAANGSTDRKSLSGIALRLAGGPDIHLFLIMITLQTHPRATLLLLLAALLGALSGGTRAAAEVARAQPASPGLRILPENPRYFEYKGLPLVLFMHKGGVEQMPYPNEKSLKGVVQGSRFANHYYMPAHHTWVRATPRQVLEQLQDDQHWRSVREIVRAAHEHDVIVHLFFWSYKFNYGKQDWTGSDMVWPNPEDDGGVLLDSPRLTRREVHELAIERTLKATWDLPNVVYNFMWEYNVRQTRQDPEGRFHRWWANRVREVGRTIDPSIEHRISVKLGRMPPSQVGADFVVEEDGNGFWFHTSHRQVLEYGVPAVFISSDYPFADNPFTGWENVPHSPKIWANGQVDEYHISPQEAYIMAAEGFHPAESFAPATAETLEYFLQARWYLENVGILHTDPDGRVKGMPLHRPSQRPVLENPDGFEHGRRGDRYAVVYRHPEGLAPAQAEVWIDVNGDGRFSPDPAGGERFTLVAQGSGDYRSGVLFTGAAPADRPYVFRFADRNWNPPVRGGLVPGKTEGISYARWGVSGLESGGAVEAARR
jgi:hypothetical protein